METITLVLSGLGAAAAIASAWIAWKVLTISRDQDLPAVTVQLGKDGRWVTVRIGLVNRSDVPWRAEQATVRWPRGAKLISEFDVPRAATEFPFEARPDKDLIDLASLGAEAQMRLAVAPAGDRREFSSPLTMGSMARHQETLFLKVPDPTRSIKLSIRVSLASIEAVQRRRTIAIKRTLPAAAKRITD